MLRWRREVSCPGRSAALLQRCAAEPGPMSPNNPCCLLGPGSAQQRCTLQRVRDAESVGCCCNVARRAKHLQPRQPLPAKIFHFTEIRNCGIRRNSPARGRGAVRESFETRAGLRWTRQRRHEQVAGRAGSPCESAATCRRTTLNAYGKTVWSWPSLLRSSLCGDVREPNRVDGIIQFAGRGRPEGKFGSRESTA